MCGVIYDHPVYSIQHAKLATVFGYYLADPCCVVDRKMGLAQKYSALFQQAGVYCSLMITTPDVFQMGLHGTYYYTA